MTGRGGQALRVLHHCGRAVMLLVMVLAVGLGLVAWRLAEGPMVAPWLAGRLVAAAEERLAPARLGIGGAAIAWAGWRGAAAPFELRLTDVRLHDSAGVLRAAVPEAHVALSLPALLRGRIAPATIALDRPLLRLRRDAAGVFGLDLAGDAEAALPAPAESAAADGSGLLAALFDPSTGFATSLQSLRVNEATIVASDLLPARPLTVAGFTLTLRRQAGALVAEGGARLLGLSSVLPLRISGRADAGTLHVAVDLPPLRPGDFATWLPAVGSIDGLALPVTVAVAADLDAGLRARAVTVRFGFGEGAALAGAATVAPAPDGWRLEAARLTLGGAVALTGSGGLVAAGEGWDGTLALDLAPFEAAAASAAWPAALVPAWRERWRAALPRGRVDGAARVAFHLDGAGAPTRLAGTARMALADATIGVAEGRVPVAAAELGLALDGDALRIEAARLKLADAPDGSVGPTLELGGGARRRDGVWRAAIDARLDQLAVTGLPHWWPLGVQRAERLWLTRNLTAGIARNGVWRLAAEAPEATPWAVSVTALDGRAEWADATIHWLRPVPPFAGASGTAEFGLDSITLRGGGGRQLDAEGRPTGLAVRDAAVRFLELDTRPGRLEITADVAGPLPDTVTLLRHPRLKLFEKRPLALRATGGRAEARLVVGFPLWNELPAEAVAIRATGRLAEARIADALLGQDLEAGQLGFEVDTEGLSMRGEARIAGAPLRVTLGMDFRTGGPTQVMERATIATTVDPGSLKRLGVDAGEVFRGAAAITAEARRQRDGDGTVALRGELSRARLALPPLGWSKAAGVPGTAEATLRLRGDALTAVEGVRVQAPELLLRGALALPGGRLARVELAELRVGATRAAGDAVAPRAAGEPWRVALRGPVLDVAPLLAAERGPAGAAAEPNPPLDLDLRFERVAFAPGRELTGFAAEARTDAAGVVQEARVAARAGEGAVAASLTPAGARREVRLSAADTGALLRALDVTDVVRGGRLTAEAQYAGNAADAPLAGSATLDGFAIRDAPAAGKLLQMLSVYGVVEAMQGGNDLLFSRAIMPFTLTPGALAIDDARAYSASLGLTARGRLLRGPRTIDLEGTIVPAYALNTALGNLPLVGRLFSAEVGGGLFAATWRLAGPLAEPGFSVNPLAALTPGFLRGLFGAPDPTRAPRVVETPKPLD